MRRVYLLRHGKTKANDENRYCGSMDLPLTKRGIAALEGKKDMFYYPLPENTLVYTSGKLRTEQTLTVLFGKIAHATPSAIRAILINYKNIILHLLYATKVKLSIISAAYSLKAL